MTKWLEILHKYEREGFKEIPGTQHNPIILGWMQGPGGAPWTDTDDGDNPWCGGAAAGVLTEAGFGQYLPSLPVRASTWLELPDILDEPRPGCIVVFKRKGGHHVTFVSRIEGGILYCIGGNQSNKICTTGFKRFNSDGAEAALGYRWPIPLKTKSQVRKVSRIATAARRQQQDAAKGGGAVATVPVIPDVMPPAAPPSTAGLKETVETMMVDVSWVQKIAEHLTSFGGYVQGHWFYVAVAIALFFGARMMWDSHLIKQWRTDDANEGFST